MTQDRGERVDATDLQDEPLPLAAWRGPFPGTVVSTADPLKRGRVRVRAPQVYGADELEDDYIPDAELPWARPTLPTHDFHVGFAVGDGVWITFWGESPCEPVLLGQFIGDGDAPPEFLSSYTPDPRTRILRTTNGHSIEMRWVDGQERMTIKTAAGVEIEMLDAPTLGGVKLTARTPNGRRMMLDDLLQKVTLETPTQTIIMDDLVGAIQVTTPGEVSVTAGGPVTVTGGASETKTFSAGPGVGTYLTLALTALTAMGLSALTLSATAVGVLTLTGATVVIVSATAINIGTIGAYRRLLDERFATLYDGHVHPDPLSGVTGPPTTLAVPTIANFATSVLRGN